MKPKPEVSMMIGAGAGTHIAGYDEAMKMRDFGEFSDEIEAHLKAGAKMIMVESEGLTEDLPPDRWRKDVVKKLVERFGYKTFMFEASDPPVFKWYLTTFGRDVNLFIDHSQVVEFAAWRTRLWGDREIWEGKKVEYT
jgi:phosphosulfolactate synthase (CoM biosynthesis protein A)